VAVVVVVVVVVVDTGSVGAEDVSKMEDKMGALEAPAPQNTTVRVNSFRTGKVSVIRWEGGLGESSIPATHNWDSCNKG
jgi:hypothetical protein